MAEQSYTNHVRRDWRFHAFLTFVLTLLLAQAVWRLWKEPGVWAALHLLYALGACMAVLLIRIYALKVQDRVIRLEERLRMQALLPDSLRPRIHDLEVPQIVALRFASDVELPTLMEQTLNNRWSPKEIKQNIRVWRPDHHRV